MFCFRIANASEFADKEVFCYNNKRSFLKLIPKDSGFENAICKRDGRIHEKKSVNWTISNLSNATEFGGMDAFGRGLEDAQGHYEPGGESHQRSARVVPEEATAKM